MRDGELLELMLDTCEFAVPEFGRSVTLTAADNRVIGDRDGIICKIAQNQSNKIEKIYVTDGYIQQISGHYACTE